MTYPRFRNAFEDFRRGDTQLTDWLAGPPMLLGLGLGGWTLWRF